MRLIKIQGIRDLNPGKLILCVSQYEDYGNINGEFMFFKMYSACEGHLVPHYPLRGASGKKQHSSVCMLSVNNLRCLILIHNIQ